MKKHIKYPKITQFRNVVSTIKRQADFVGLDDNGDAIYDSSQPKPVLTFKGTIKLHGTNAGVCYNKEQGMWVQSRENIITPEKDNAGFAFFVEANKDVFYSLFNTLDALYNLEDKTFSIYGEWAGKGIQKGVGISEIDKSFYIFGVKISKPQEEGFTSFWVDSSMLSVPAHRIYNIEDFTVFYKAVDFNMPQLAQNYFSELTLEVENECPVAKAFGIENGVGEGIVWSCEYKGTVHRFKVKGEKHSVSKVKKLATVDVEKLNSINEFVEYAVTENRFNQALENVFGKEPIVIEKLGDLIRWVIKDITDEEMDTMVENNLEPKDVNKYISGKVKEMFFKLDV